MSDIQTLTCCAEKETEHIVLFFAIRGGLEVVFKYAPLFGDGACYAWYFVRCGCVCRLLIADIDVDVFAAFEGTGSLVPIFHICEEQSPT